jgi:formyl-CoA transferase
VPCGPILSMKDLYNDPSLRKSGTLVEVQQPDRGSFVTVANPIRLSDNQVPVTRSPLLGEHTAEILKSLGYSDKEIEALRSEGTV